MKPLFDLVVIAAALILTCGCTSSGPNSFERGDIVAPAAAPESGALVIVWYDRDTDQYTVDAVRKNTVTGEWWRYADGFGREQKQIKDREAYDKIMVKIDHDGGAAGTAGISGQKVDFGKLGFGRGRSCRMPSRWWIDSISSPTRPAVCDPSLYPFCNASP